MPALNVTAETGRRAVPHAPESSDPQLLLQTLRATSPCTTRLVQGVSWEYIGRGSGPGALLLLPGALGLAETSFRQILAFAGAYKVLSLSYPGAIYTLDRLLDGIVGVLDVEAITTAHVIGGSYSGLVAQHFAATNPQRVASLLLSNTGAPQPAHVRRLFAYARIIAWIPQPALQRVLSAAIPRFLPLDNAEHRFWRTYFVEILPGFTREVLVNRMRVHADMNRVEHTARWSAAPWTGPTLIVEAERDALLSAGKRAALRCHFPHATHVSLAGRGHSAALDAADIYLAIYREFLCSLES